MAALQHLTDELLVEIIKFSACDRTTLLTVATVNERFNELATQILVRDIDIHVQSKDQGEQHPLLMGLYELMRRSFECILQTFRAITYRID